MQNYPKDKYVKGGRAASKRRTLVAPKIIFQRSKTAYKCSSKPFYKSPHIRVYEEECCDESYTSTVKFVENKVFLIMKYGRHYKVFLNKVLLLLGFKFFNYKNYPHNNCTTIIAWVELVKLPNENPYDLVLELTMAIFFKLKVQRARRHKF